MLGAKQIVMVDIFTYIEFMLTESITNTGLLYDVMWSLDVDMEMNKPKPRALQ